MSSNQTKAGGKPKPRKAKPAQGGDKAKQRNRQAAAKVAEAVEPPSAPEQAETPVDLTETEALAAPAELTETETPAAVALAETETPASAPVALTETEAPPSAPADVSPPAPADASPTVPAEAEESAPVSYRTLVDAWGTYSRTSLEQTKAYLEKLATVRSLGGAFEVQAEFTRQACETFVAHSQRIGELQNELARQRLKRLEGFVEKMTQGAPGRRS